MENIDFVGILLRWMHIFAAIALFGGTIFQRIALHPTVGELDAAQRATVAAAVRRRWSKVVMISILFLLVSGVVPQARVFGVLANPAPLTVGAMFILSAALVKCGAIDRLGLLSLGILLSMLGLIALTCLILIRHRWRTCGSGVT